MFNSKETFTSMLEGFKGQLQHFIQSLEPTQSDVDDVKQENKYFKHQVATYASQCERLELQTRSLRDNLISMAFQRKRMKTWDKPYIHSLRREIKIQNAQGIVVDQ